MTKDPNMTETPTSNLAGDSQMYAGTLKDGYWTITSNQAEILQDRDAIFLDAQTKEEALDELQAKLSEVHDTNAPLGATHIRKVRYQHILGLEVTKDPHFDTFEAAASLDRAATWVSPEATNYYTDRLQIPTSHHATWRRHPVTQYAQARKCELVPIKWNRIARCGNKRITITPVSRKEWVRLAKQIINRRSPTIRDLRALLTKMERGFRNHLEANGLQVREFCVSNASKKKCRDAILGFYRNRPQGIKWEAREEAAAILRMNPDNELAKVVRRIQNS
jgi:hypothetical protein